MVITHYSFLRDVFFDFFLSYIGVLYVNWICFNITGNIKIHVVTQKKQKMAELLSNQDTVQKQKHAGLPAFLACKKKRQTGSLASMDALQRCLFRGGLTLLIELNHVLENPAFQSICSMGDRVEEPSWDFEYSK